MLSPSTTGQGRGGQGRCQGREDPLPGEGSAHHVQAGGRALTTPLHLFMEGGGREGGREEEEEEGRERERGRVEGGGGREGGGSGREED